MYPRKRSRRGQHDPSGIVNELYDKGWSTLQIARGVGVSDPTVRRWATGKFNTFSKNMEKLNGLLDKDPSGFDSVGQTGAGVLAFSEKEAKTLHWILWTSGRGIMSTMASRLNVGKNMMHRIKWGRRGYKFLREDSQFIDGEGNEIEA